VGNSLAPASMCDGNGACVGSAREICAPFACDAQAAACSATCASDAECSNAKCVDGACRGTVGTGSCQHGGECTSGFCVDGVCCNVACQGACVSCATPGHIGVCEPVAAGNRDPRAVCVDQGATSCGTTGKCDGLGACALYAGVLCAPVTCEGATLTPARYCDGSGACAAAHQTQSCAPLACRTDVAQCADNCPAGDTICMPGAYCSGNEVCAPRKAGGMPCAGDHECISFKCQPGLDGGPSSCATLI